MASRLNDAYFEKERRNKPGPGSYEAQNASQKVIKNAPCFKIGTSKRNNSLSNDKVYFPDPTTYAPKDDFVRQKYGSFVFGTSVRNSLDNNKDAPKVPGPGQYELPPRPFDKPKFAMGIKFKNHQADNTPGPGQYTDNLKAVNKTMPSFTIKGRVNK